MQEVDPKELFGIGVLVQRLWNGDRVASASWPPSDWVWLVQPRPGSSFTEPVIAKKTGEDRAPWFPTHVDVLKKDYYVVK